MRSTAVRGSTSGRRALAATGVGLVALAGAAGLVQQQAVALQVNLQARTSEFSTSAVRGTGVAFATVPATVSDGQGGTRQVQVLRGEMADARLDGLCISQRQELLGLPYTLKVLAGDGRAGTLDVLSTTAQFDLIEARGGAAPGISLDGVVQVGQSATDVVTEAGRDNPLNAPSTGRHVAINATAGELNELRATAYGFTIRGAPKIPGLRVAILPGEVGCADSEFPR